MTGVDNIVEWMHFVSSIVSSCAWPCAIMLIVVLVVFRFHKPLGLVISSLQRVTVGNVDVYIAREVQTAKSEADAAGIPRIDEDTGSQAPPSDAGSTGESIDAFIVELALSDPAAAIEFAWSRLAKELVVTAKRVLLLPKGAAEAPSWAGPARHALEQKGYLDHETARIISSLRHLAFMVQQKRSEAMPRNADTAIEYARLAERIKKVLREVNLRLG